MTLPKQPYDERIKMTLSQQRELARRRPVEDSSTKRACPKISHRHPWAPPLLLDQEDD